jgi:hypothetical protein
VTPEPEFRTRQFSYDAYIVPRRAFDSDAEFESLAAAADECWRFR